MSRGKSLTLSVLALVLVGGVAGVLLLRSNLDDLVRRMLERTGAEVTGTRVSVASVSLALREGRGTVRGIDVANPAGFSGNDAFRLGTLVVDLDVKSLTGDPIVIEEIRVEAPRLVVEPLPDGRVNLEVLRHNAQAYGSGSPGKDEESPRRLRIRRLVFEDGELVLDLEAVGRGTRTAPLPAFRLTNLGGTEGAEPGRIGQEVVGALVREGLAAAARQGLADEVKEEIGKRAGEAAQGAIDQLLH